MRIIYLIILLIFSTTSIIAQSKESKDLNIIIDYVTCVCVNDALPDNKKINCDNDQLTLNSIPEEEKSTIDLFNEFQKLRVKTKIKDTLQFFSEDIFNNEKQFSKIHAFAENKKRKGKKIDDIKSNIKIFIENKRQKETETNLNSDQQTIELVHSENANIENQDSLSAVDIDVSNNITPPPASTFFSFNFWAFCCIGLIILSIILFFILNKHKTKIKKDSDDLIKNLANKNKREQSFAIENYQDKIRALDIKIFDLENKNKDLNDLLSNKIQQNIITNTIRETNTEIELEVPPKPVQEEFYMATPDQNNFDLSSLSNTFKPTQSLYKFTVDNDNKSKATFIFHSDEIGIKDAVNYPHRSILPVCEPQNALNQNAKNINTITPGIAEKSNDKWVVTTKAKIKYE
jgi:hypothetical protein